MSLKVRICTINWYAFYGEESDTTYKILECIYNTSPPKIYHENMALWIDNNVSAFMSTKALFIILNWYKCPNRDWLLCLRLSGPQLHHVQPWNNLAFMEPSYHSSCLLNVNEHSSEQHSKSEHSDRNIHHQTLPTHWEDCAPAWPGFQVMAALAAALPLWSPGPEELWAFPASRFNRSEQRGLRWWRRDPAVPRAGLPSRERVLTSIFTLVRFYLKVFSEAQKENTSLKTTVVMLSSLFLFKWMQTRTRSVNFNYRDCRSQI